MKKPEKVLSQIKLKYFSNRKKPFNEDSQCFLCRKKRIKVGSFADAYTDNPKPICEDCTIFNFMIDYGFRTKKAAAARRRRMFDVSYLFQEMVIDKYMSENNTGDIDELDEEIRNMLFETGAEAYNRLLNKEEKIALEEVKSQEEIEERLEKLLTSVKF